MTGLSSILPEKGEFCGRLVDWRCACMLSHFSRVQLFATLWTVACQAPLSTGILQARILECVATPSSKGSSQLRDQTCISYISCIRRQVLYH